MNQELIASLRAQLARCEETGNPRAAQVRARLAEELGEEPGALEDAAQSAPKETAVQPRRGRPRKDT